MREHKTSLEIGLRELNMRVIDMSNMEVVFKGAVWEHSIAPCSKAAIPLLERNEKIVSWTRRKGGTVTEQIPAILYQGNYYTLSLRMQKAIYRHIRLKKGFNNVEEMDGTLKLRIPEVLLKEKIRTQSRFEAMRGMERKKGQPVEKLKGEGTTTIRRDSGGGGSGSSKKASSRNFRGKQQRPMSTHTVSSRLQDVVKTIVEENRHRTVRDDNTNITVFLHQSHVNELMIDLIQEIRKISPSACPAAPEHKSDIMNLIEGLYDGIVQQLPPSLAEV